MLFPWIPDWIDLNVVVPAAAMIIVIVVGIFLICVIVSHKSSQYAAEQARFRGFFFEFFLNVSK